MLKVRTCQIRGCCSPGHRSFLNLPLRICRISPASLIKAKRPANTRATGPARLLCHRRCPAESPQVFSPNRLGSCYQVAFTLLPSQASAARTRGGAGGGGEGRLWGTPPGPRALSPRRPLSFGVHAPPRQKPEPWSPRCRCSCRWPCAPSLGRPPPPLPL